MKSLMHAMVSILFLTMIISCEKDETETLTKEVISAKWLVDGSSNYISFEFNESGNYIIVKEAVLKSSDDGPVIFGTYEIKDNTTIVLSDFGTLKISEITGNSINFSIQLSGDPDNEIPINATKQEEMESSTRTDLISRTWEMVSIDDELVAGTDMELTILFSAAGTYFVSYIGTDQAGDGGLAQWKWKDETETQLLYSWEEVPVWEEAGYVDISELSASTLKIIEDDEVYVLQPVVNKKSSGMTAPNSRSDRSVGKNFFGK